MRESRVATPAVWQRRRLKACEMQRCICFFSILSAQFLQMKIRGEFL